MVKRNLLVEVTVDNGETKYSVKTSNPRIAILQFQQAVECDNTETMVMIDQDTGEILLELNRFTDREYVSDEFKRLYSLVRLEALMEEIWG